MLAPVIHLNPLNYEEMLVLTEKLSEIHSGLFGYEQKITQNDLINFIQVEYSRIGSDTHITPREIIRDFIELLDIVYQNPQIVISDFIASENMVYSKPETEQEASDSEFAEFEI